MTVLMREDLNETDLAWAAADHSVAGVLGQLLRARQDVGTDPGAEPARRERTVIDPAVLRARGAL